MKTTRHMFFFKANYGYVQLGKGLAPDHHVHSMAGPCSQPLTVIKGNVEKPQVCQAVLRYPALGYCQVFPLLWGEGLEL